MIKQFSTSLYLDELSKKINSLKHLMAEFEPPELVVFPSAISQYRMRAEFRIWHKGEDLYHVMYDKLSKKRIRIDSFPIASEIINQAMHALVPLLQHNAVLRDLLFQIDYLSTLSNQLLITLIYHKKLTDEWVVEAKKLRSVLIKQGINVNIVGRATNQKIALDCDYVDEVLPVLEQNFIYRQIENTFTQPNAGVNIKMLEWTISVTKNSANDLLEFYCGNGNFSIALAQNFRKVLATEIAKSSVQAANYNIIANKIDNLKIVRLSAAEFTSAINKERVFKRLKDINLDEYDCQTVLVDPPRNGLDEDTLNLLKNYQKIIYISCNPNSLYQNLLQLTQTHQIKHFALFDQFPYTDHIETGIVLEK